MTVRLGWLLLSAVAAAFLLLCVAIGGASTEAKEQGQKAQGSPTPTKTTKPSVGTNHPDPPSVLRRPSTTTPEESAALERRLEKMREQTDAANAKRYRGGIPPLGAPVVAPTKVTRESVGGLLVRKNYRNTVAQAQSSTLTEPAAAADEREVLYAGNTYLSRSTDSGATWVNAGPYPAGPADAPEACCDTDVVHASTTDTTFNVILYTNNALTNGVVRIFVRRGNISDGVDCTYTIDPAGTSNNIVPDYPHIATDNNYLYLSVNLLHNNTSWLGARTMRWPLQQISNCQTATRGTFTYDNLRRTGQRVHVPVENATRTMFWGQLDNPTTFRIFSWDDFRIKEWVWPVNSTEFNNPDCRGGVGHFDWIEGSPSWSITGFRMRGATTEKSELPYGPYGTVLFLWPAAPDLLHHQAHLHGAVFDADSLQFVAETRVFSNSFCYGYPALGANSFGEYALSVAFGGDRTANSGTSAQSGVTVSRGWPAYDFPTAQRTAGGTHNRTDERFGDYFTVRKNERCPNTWNATNYALSGGNTLPAHVDARYVEFQSRTTPPCPL